MLKVSETDKNIDCLVKQNHEFSNLRKGASNAYRGGWYQVRIQKKVIRVDLQLEEQDSSSDPVHRVSTHGARAKLRSYRFQFD